MCLRRDPHGHKNKENDMGQKPWARWVKLGGQLPPQGLNVVAVTLDTGAASRKSCLGLARYQRGKWTLISVLTPDWVRWGDARLTSWLSHWFANDVAGPVVRRLGESVPETDEGDDEPLPVTMNMELIRRCWRAHLKTVGKSDI